jgi:hypothetical protein
MTELGEPPRRIRESRARRGGSRAASAELAGEQVGADERQRVREE